MLIPLPKYPAEQSDVFEMQMASVPDSIPLLKYYPYKHWVVFETHSASSPDAGPLLMKPGIQDVVSEIQVAFVPVWIPFPKYPVKQFDVLEIHAISVPDVGPFLKNPLAQLCELVMHFFVEPSSKVPVGQVETHLVAEPSSLNPVKQFEALLMHFVFDPSLK